jgi:hypothetical protein
MVKIPPAVEILNNLSSAVAEAADQKVRNWLKERKLQQLR